jgi:hypothetical protein
LATNAFSRTWRTAGTSPASRLSFTDMRAFQPGVNDRRLD